MDGLESALAKEYDSRVFRTHQRFLVPALVIMVLTVFMFLVTANSEDVWGMGLWLSMWSVGIYVLAVSAIREWHNASKTHFGGVIFSTLFAVPFVAGEVAVVVLLARQTSLMALLILMGMGLLLVGFRRWMKAPTRMGRKLMDELEGFRMYLTVGESDRLAAMKGPERTPELFETFLPYALALDVEQAWAESFAEVLAKAARHHEGDYSPRWYRSDHSAMSMDRFTRSIGDSLASAVNSSSISASSGSRGGSGFSSGGSSGGGGGGGGGGW